MRHAAFVLLPLILLVLQPASASAATIFISNERDNTVTVLDSETLEIKKIIKSAGVRAASSWRPTTRKFMSASATTTRSA